MKYLLCLSFIWFLSASQDAPKKANTRSAASPTETADPFEGASVEKMGSQCITLETDLGAIEIAMMPEVAPEAVRNFLNLSALAHSTQRRSVEC